MVNGLKIICKGDEKNTHQVIAPPKENRRVCGNSPAACRVPKNADSICEQFNRETSGTQENLFL